MASTLEPEEADNGVGYSTLVNQQRSISTMQLKMFCYTCDSFFFRVPHSLLNGLSTIKISEAIVIKPHKCAGFAWNQG